MRIAYRVQNAVGREAPLARLLSRLPPAVEVITDEESESDPNPMRNYLRCLENIPNGATHLCVIQDDALPTSHFGLKLNEAIKDRPTDVLSLFVGALSNRTRKEFYSAMKSGSKWCPIYFRDIHHVVGLVWPRDLAEHFLEWYPKTRIPGPIPPKSDDAVVGFWARKNRKMVWATVPCLLEHPDDFPSTIRSHSRFGDKTRRAIYFEE